MSDLINPASNPREVVVMLHGLGRTLFSMSLLGNYLRRHGFDAFNVGYSSLRQPIAKHSAKVKLAIDNEFGADPLRLSFVTHSLGSIVARQFISDYQSVFEFNRMVMLGPPNQGSSMARRLGKIPIVDSLVGPSFRELKKLDVPNPASLIEIGIIAGGRNHDRGFSPLLSGDNDGIVTVQETHLPGAKGHIVLPGLHSFLMYFPEVKAQTLRFLSEGRFGA